MDDAQIIEVIRQVHADTGYILDPHTATAFTDMAGHEVTSVVLSTAHPAKFPDVVQRAIHIEPLHPALEALKTKTLQRHPLPADVETIKSFISAHTQR
jgi:threonine synthase